MRRHIVAVLVAAMAVALLPAVAVSKAETWFEDGFSDGVPAELGDGWGWEPTAGGHVGRGLLTRMAEGEHWGASGHIDMDEIGAGRTDELFWRYWLRLDADFYVAPPSRGKLPGPAGLYTYNCLGGRVSSPSEPCWSARTMFSRTYPRFGEPGYPNGPDDRTQLGSYIYHLDGPSNRGEAVLWEDDVSILEHGRWYCVEGRVSMNTPGEPDGVLQAWIDGEQAYDRTDLRFRRSAEGRIHVKSFWMDVYHGGSGVSAADNGVWLDSLALGPQRQGCDDSDRIDGRFRDDDSSVHVNDIEWLASTGITRGCNPPTNDRFCPSKAVTRGEMATFLRRSLELPASSDHGFRDVGGSPHEQGIAALARAGVTRGCNPPRNDRFCPDAAVTRAEMAVFLQRGYELPAGSATSFNDTDGSVYEPAIEALAGVGVTKGCNPPANDRYCPAAAVTRGQMASFVRRAQSTAAR